jgi:hypothetical protein
MQSKPPTMRPLFRQTNESAGALHQCAIPWPDANLVAQDVMTKTMNQFSFAAAIPLSSTNVMQLNVMNVMPLSSTNVMQLNVMDVTSLTSLTSTSVMLQDVVMTHDGTRLMGSSPLMRSSFGSRLACAGSRPISNRRLHGSVVHERIM